MEGKHSVYPVTTFKDYEAFSENVGDFRRNLYKFVDIFGDSSETFGDGKLVHGSWFMRYGEWLMEKS